MAGGTSQYGDCAARHPARKAFATARHLIESSAVCTAGVQRADQRLHAASNAVRAYRCPSPAGDGSLRIPTASCCPGMNPRSRNDTRDVNHGIRQFAPVLIGVVNEQGFYELKPLTRR